MHVKGSLHGSQPENTREVGSALFTQGYVPISFEYSLSYHICDMIKGNESLVENFNFYFLTPLSQIFKMLHFDTIRITIGHLVTEL